MKLLESAIGTLKKYADFKGRASREEFWCFFAFLIIVNAAASIIGMLLGFGRMLSSAVMLLLIIPQLAVAVRRLHDLGKSGRELVVPCLMLLLLPIAFAFRGILPQIVALGFLGLTLLAFAHLLTLFMKKGTSVPNRFGAAPTAPLHEEGHLGSQSLRRGADGLLLRELTNTAVVLGRSRR